MSLAGRIGWRWRRVTDPAPPQGVVAWGDSARRLLVRLLTMSAGEQAHLEATANHDLLFVSGASHLLPWVEGVAYAAPHVRSPRLWLPTLAEPDVPVDLLGQALQQRHARTPLLLWNAPQAVVPLDRQMPVCTAHLERIAELWEGRRAER